MTTLSINPYIEYTVIGFYLALMLVIGWVFKNFNKNVGDYFRSGSQGTWWIVGVSAFMAGISAFSFIGTGGAAFEAGWSVMSMYLGNLAGVAALAVFLAGWYRQMRAITFPEVIRSRFGPLTQQVYAWLTVPMFLMWGAIWLLGLAIFSSGIFGLPINLVIPVLGVVVLSYATAGGKWAVMAADFVQGLILVLMCVLITTLCLIKTGGVGGLFELISERGLNDEFAFIKPEGSSFGGAYTLKWVLATFVMQFIFFSGLSNCNRFFAVKDGREARRAAWLMVLLMAGGVLLWFIPPITARLFYEAEVMAAPLSKPQESAFAVVSIHLLPNGLIGLMVVAMFSATMSSMDAGLNGNAAIFIRDILPATCRLFGWRLPSDRMQLLLSRLVTIVFGIMLIGLAIYLSRQEGAGIFEIAIVFSSLVGLPMALPMFLCLFVKRVPAWSALFSGAVCALPSIVMLFAPDLLSFSGRVFWQMVLGSAAFFATRLFWNTSSVTYREQVEAFFERMHTPVNYAEEVGTDTDGIQLVVLGRFVGVISVFLALLLLLPNELFGRLCIGALALTCGSLAAAMVWLGRRKSQRVEKSTHECPEFQGVESESITAENASN